ncbi:MAG: alpha-hydroxy-acid oxidizing protein, partial [bacterium]
MNHKTVEMSMDIQIIREKAKKKLAGICKVCDLCDGKACTGQIPGLGGIGTGASFKANIDSLARFEIINNPNFNIIPLQPEITLFGKKITSPILIAPMSGTEENLGGVISEEKFAYCLVKGAQAAGTLAFTGDGDLSIKFESG